MDEFTKTIEVNDISMDKDAELKLFKELAEVDGFKEYLKLTLGADIRRHFGCPKDQQETVKGAYARTKYFLDLLMRA